MKHAAMAWFVIALIALAAVPVATAFAQSATVDDPIVAAQAAAAGHAAPPAGVGAAVTTIDDPIRAAQVLAAAEKTFPNLAADLENAELLRKAAADPILRGNLRGRIAEEVWFKHHEKDGWKRHGDVNDPQIDFERVVDGKVVDTAQLKVRNDWHNYIRDMRKDDEAKRFVVPDDQFEFVYKELETRRIGALRGGLTEKAEEYAIQQTRLTKFGKTFTEIDGAIEPAGKNYGRIAEALRAGGKAASFVAIGAALLDGGIAVYEVAVGKAEVDDLVKRLSKDVVGGAAAWVIADAAVYAAGAAGATGAVPVAVAIVVGTATYLVVDWAIDKAADSMRVGHLTIDDIKRVWPEGARGIPLDQLYRKPEDPAALLGK